MGTPGASAAGVEVSAERGTNAVWGVATPPRRRPTRVAVRSVEPMREHRGPFAGVLSRLARLYGRVLSRPRSSPPAPTTTGTPLDAVNEKFHAAHAGARSAAKHDDPVLIVLADDLILLHRGERTVYSFSPPTFHVLKSVAHAPVALYALCEAGGSAGGPDKLAALQSQVRRVLEDLSFERFDLNSAARADARLVLESTRDAALELAQTHARKDAFAASVGPALLRLAHEATRIQLAALHGHTQRVLADLSPEQRSALHVVVTGDHQARIRSLPMQYYKRVLSEPSDAEHHVTYAEGVRDEQAAFDLVGAQRLDRRLASAFFHDEKRLQRDILGDAATAVLKAFDLGAMR